MRLSIRLKKPGRNEVLKLVFQFGSTLEEKEDEAVKHFAETRVGFHE